MRLDPDQPFSKVVSADENTQTIFRQNGIDFDIKGEPLDEKQVQAFHAQVAADAQAKADAAKAAAEAAQAEADGVRQSLGVTKTAVKKASK